jgi:hypothetical protein
MHPEENTHFYTIEVYNRRKWSDRYSPTYPTFEEAKEKAEHLYENDPDNVKGVHISNYYRIKETQIITTTHEL